MAEKARRTKLTKVSAFHYFRLTYRSALFVAALIIYIGRRINNSGSILDFLEGVPFIAALIWIVFMVEMVFRFFPSKLESPGCQKQFARNYVPTGVTKPVLHDNNATILVALIWIALNALIGAAYMLDWLDDDIMLLVSLVYSVCDMICILFFCPFQSWFLKNKCCSSCRIYNWDYAMMFTPLFFVKGFYCWSLLGAAVILMIKWEITVYKYPERFSEVTNSYLRCANCTEKLCTHKKQLHTLWQQLREQEKQVEARIRLLGKKTDR